MGSLGERPGGIFSNPMFVGRLTSSTKYGVVYNEPDEIAGHHVVYSITADDELVIEAVPLQHYNPIDPTTAFDVRSVLTTAPFGVTPCQCLS